MLVVYLPILNEDEKLGQILNYALNFKLDVVAITETWLNANTSSSLLSLDGYLPPERRDRTTGRGGGVMIYCSIDTPYTRRHDLEGQSESLWIQIETSKSNFILVGVYYRPPGQSAAERDIFLDDFANSAVEALSNPADSVIILGDFNDCCVKWDSDHTKSELRNKLRDLSIYLGLSQMINDPTHISNEGTPDHILDLILTNTPDMVGNTYILAPISNCDHCFITCNMLYTKPVYPQNKRTIWNFNEADFDGLNV